LSLNINNYKLFYCPLGCVTKVELKYSRRIIESNGVTYSGNFWFYECPSCNNNFTTTESDTISQENLIKIKSQNNEE
jgi:transcriptional regulator NrdR family protein